MTEGIAWRLVDDKPCSTTLTRRTLTLEICGPQSKLKAKPTVAGCITVTTKRTAWYLVIVRPCSMTPVQQNLLDAILGSTTFKKYATSSSQKLAREMVKNRIHLDVGKSHNFAFRERRFLPVLNRLPASVTRRGVPIWTCETGMCSLSQVDDAGAAASQKLQTALKSASPRTDLEVHTSVLHTLSLPVEANDIFRRQFTPSCNFQSVV